MHELMAAFDASRLSIHNSSISSQEQQQQQQQQSKRPCNNNSAAPQSPGSAAPLTIVVKNQLDEEVHFKILGSTTFDKVFAAYEQRMLAGQPAGDEPAYHFLFDGHRLNPSCTPRDVRMVDGDVIDALLVQLGD
jgi:hypothetical protein